MKKAFEKLPTERREAILDAAIAVFAERGFYGTGIADICAAAGISNGALYKYFDNKDDLFRCVAERGARIIDGLYRGVDKALPRREYFRSLLEAIRTRSDALSPAISLYIEQGNPALSRFAEAISGDIEGAGIGHVVGYLEGARLRGETRGTLDLPAAAFAIDNLIVLYGFSLVSAYHEKRIASFMGEGRVAGRVEFILRTIDMILS